MGNFVKGEIRRAMKSERAEKLNEKYFEPWRESSEVWQEEKRSLPGYLWEYYFGKE
jgi:hypothetical protein